MTTSPYGELQEVAADGSEDELTDSTVYSRLSKLGIGRNPAFSETLAKLAETEMGHYNFWKKYIPERRIRANSVRVYFAILLRLILGVTFVVRYLERNETKVIARYKSVAHLIPAEDKSQFELMLQDEVDHEKGFEEKLRGRSIQYIGFVVLGLSDAVVEIAGIHAGSLGIYNSTRIAGLAGVIAGAAASIAMASAAYAQAKQGFGGSATIAAIYTGMFYFIAALVLATPYFLTEVMTLAVSVSLALGVALVSFVSFYTAVVSGKGFARDFGQITGIMFGATLAIYILGIGIRHLFGITI